MFVAQYVPEEIILLSIASDATYSNYKIFFFLEAVPRAKISPKARRPRAKRAQSRNTRMKLRGRLANDTIGHVVRRAQENQKERVK